MGTRRRSSMNNRKIKKIRKATALYAHPCTYTLQELMRSYYWWLKYLKKRDYKKYKSVKNKIY